MLRDALCRLRALVRRDHVEQALDAELRMHVEQQVAAYCEAGVSADEAARRTRLKSGALEPVKDACHDVRGSAWWDTIRQDARFAVRMLWRDRGFAVTVALVLGLGIGVNNVFFTLMYGFKLRGLPIAGADRVLSLSTIDERARDQGVSVLDLEDWQQAQHSFVDMAAFADASVTVGDEGRSPDRFDASYMTANAFALLGIAPVVGRPLSPEDDRRGAFPVVLLGMNAWRSRYGGDPAVVGRPVLIDGSPATVVGIVPERSGFPSRAGVWLPLRHMPGLAVDRRDARTLRVFGRLRDGVAETDARAELQTVVERLARQYPDTNAHVRARVMTINERLLGDLEGWGAFIAAGFMIVIVACANVANLLLARTVRRAREIAIRASLGATRRRIVGQLLIECVVLTGLGGSIGLALSIAGTRSVRVLLPNDLLPYWTSFTMDGRVFGALAAVSLGAVAIFGLIPSLHASRTDVHRVLKDGGHRSGSSSGFQWWTTTFLTAQLALTVVLLAQLGVSNLRSPAELPTDRVVDTTDVLTAVVSLPAGRYPTPEQRWQFFQDLDQRLGANADATSFSIATALPVTGAPERRLERRDGAPAEGILSPTVMAVEIGPAYFQTLRLRLTHGRPFTPQDGGDGSDVVIVNERLGELFFPHADPLGKQIALTAATAPAAPPAWLTIVGIAPTVRQRPGPDALPVAYLPIRSATPATATVMLRTPVAAAGAASFLRTALQTIDASVPLYRMQTLSRAIANADWAGRVSKDLALTLIVLTIAVTTVGLYAVIAWGMAQRTREIGIRIALGARPRHVVRLVVRSVRVPLVLGLLMGLAGTIMWSHVFAPGRTGVRTADPLSIVVVVGGLAAMVLAAGLTPSRRALRLNAAATLRFD